MKLRFLHFKRLLEVNAHQSWQYPIALSIKGYVLAATACQADAT